MPGSSPHPRKRQPAGALHTLRVFEALACAGAKRLECACWLALSCGSLAGAAKHNHGPRKPGPAFLLSLLTSATTRTGKEAVIKLDQELLFGFAVSMAGEGRNNRASGRKHGRAEDAFTKIELIVIVGTVLLLLCLALPALVKARHSAELSQCKGNLKQITLGFSLWMEDAEVQQLPWQIQADVLRWPNLEVQYGWAGQVSESLRSNCWFQFTWLSNNLSSKVLADPADRRRGLRVAENWGASANGGFWHPNYQDNACSYGLGIDIDLGPGTFTPHDDAGYSILSLDRHLTNFVQTTNCRCQLGTVVSFDKPYNAQWTTEVHGSEGGVVGLLDGSAEYITAARLNSRLFRNSEFGPELGERAHFLFPLLK